jgi:mRNA-degrading endonuclease RelE of RelBE toxin-antitoxin system
MNCREHVVATMVEKGKQMMNIAITNAAKIAVTGLPDEERRRVHAWFDHLRNWRTDPEVRKNSRPLLPEDEHSVYVLRTTSDVRIFFTVDEDEITVLDVARKDSLRTVRARKNCGSWATFWRLGRTRRACRNSAVFQGTAASLRAHGNLRTARVSCGLSRVRVSDRRRFLGRPCGGQSGASGVLVCRTRRRQAEQHFLSYRREVCERLESSL